MVGNKCCLYDQKLLLNKLEVKMSSMVSPISQAVLRQLRLRIEVDPTPSPGSPAFRPRRRLKMKGKELELLPPELFLLNGEIEVLDLGPEREACLFYHLDQVPTDIRRLQSLVVLMLDTNELTCIPEEVCLLANLGRLSLSNNLLTELPVQFRRLEKLKSLHLVNNRLRRFPRMICSLGNLEFLDVSDNRIAELPSDVRNLRRLGALLLFMNELEELPDAVCELEELRTLWIGNNSISELPSGFGRLQELDWGVRHTPSAALEGNPLVHPPLDVCRKGVAHIAMYFKEHSNSGENSASSTK